MGGGRLEALGRVRNGKAGGGEWPLVPVCNCTTSIDGRGGRLRGLGLHCSTLCTHLTAPHGVGYLLHIPLNCPHTWHRPNQVATGHWVLFRSISMFLCSHCMSCGMGLHLVRTQLPSFAGTRSLGLRPFGNTGASAPWGTRGLRPFGNAGASAPLGTPSGYTQVLASHGLPIGGWGHPTQGRLHRSRRRPWGADWEQGRPAMGVWY